MQRYGISQLPVVRNAPVETLADVIGSLNERALLDRVFRNPDALGEDVAAAMQPPLAAVDMLDSVDEVFADLRERARRSSSPATAGPRPCSPAPTCSSTSPTAADAEASLTARGEVFDRYRRSEHAPLQLAALGQLLEGAADPRPARDPVRAGRGRRLRPLEPAETPRRQEPGAARADARAGRRPAPRRVERDHLVLRGRHRLRPDDPLDRARVLQWMFFEQYEVEPNIAVARFWITLLGEPRSTATELEGKRPQATRRSAALDGHLDGRDWLVGDASRSPTSRSTGTRMSPRRAASTSGGTRTSGRGSSASPAVPGYVPLEA